MNEKEQNEEEADAKQKHHEKVLNIGLMTKTFGSNGEKGGRIRNKRERNVANSQDHERF